MDRGALVSHSEAFREWLRNAAPPFPASSSGTRAGLWIQPGSAYVSYSPETPDAQAVAPGEVWDAASGGRRLSYGQWAVVDGTPWLRFLGMRQSNSMHARMLVTYEEAYLYEEAGMVDVPAYRVARSARLHPTLHAVPFMQMEVYT